MSCGWCYDGHNRHVSHATMGGTQAAYSRCTTDETHTHGQGERNNGSIEALGFLKDIFIPQK